jgi:hypothetical protein
MAILSIIAAMTGDGYHTIHIGLVVGCAIYVFMLNLYFPDREE